MIQGTAKTTDDLNVQYNISNNQWLSSTEREKSRKVLSETS